MQTFAEMVSAAITEGGIDSTTSGVTQTTVEDRTNDKYVEMVVRARWRKAVVSLGTTVADRAEYSIADSQIREIEGIKVGTVPYSPVGQEDLWDFGSPSTTGRYARYVFAADYTSNGVDQIEIYPAPDTDGDTITGLAVMAPERLSGSQAPVVPEEFLPAIVDGVVGHFKRLVDEDEQAAALHDARFEQGVVELRKRRNTRFGRGVVQIQIANRHF